MVANSRVYLCLTARPFSKSLLSGPPREYFDAYLVKLIDFITDETARHSGEVQEYQRQVDRLQNAIEEVTSRNTHIEVRIELSRTM